MNADLVDTKEETFRLALESICRWVHRGNMRAVAVVARVALADHQDGESVE